MDMKKYLIIFAAALLAAVSCTEEAEYTPAPKEEGTRFYLSGESTSLTINDNTESVTFPVYRTSGEGAVVKKVYVSDKSGLIFEENSVDVEFAAGETKAEITVEIDPSEFEYDVKYPVTITIKDETTKYAPSSVEFTIVNPAPWKSLGKALYRDGYVAGWYGIDALEYEVEIQENELTPGYFRLVNPYGEAFGYNDPGDYDTDKDYYMEIHAEDPDGVWIPMHWSNMHWSDGYFMMGSLAGYYIEYGGSNLEEQKAEGRTGKYADGIITFSDGQLMIAEQKYNGGQLYTIKSVFRVVMPGVVLADYSVDVEFTGLFTAKDGTISAAADVTLGPDVEYAKVVLVPVAEEEDIDAAIEEILAAEEESEDILKVEASGEIRLPLPELSELYAFVVVPFAGGEAKEDEAVYDAFQYRDFGISLTLAEPETDADGNGSITATVEFGEDTEGALAVLAPGKKGDNDALRAALGLIMSGDDSVVELEEPGDVTFPIEAEGEYLVMVASYAEGDLWNIDYDYFEYYAIDPWEDMGYIAYTDDVVSTVFGLPNITYWVPIQKNILKEGLYKLINPYHEAFPYNDPGDWDDSTDHNVVIDATDPDVVLIPEQSIGINWGYGAMSIVSLGQMYLDYGYSVEEVIEGAGDVFGKLAGGKITFPLKGLRLIMGTSAYYANQLEGFVLDLNDIREAIPEEAEPGSVRMKKSFNSTYKVPAISAKADGFSKVLKPATASSVKHGKVVCHTKAKGVEKPFGRI